MSLNGMAESRRLWCHRRVWLKCSKAVARELQVLPVRACRWFNRATKTTRQAHAPSPVFFVEAPGRPVFSSSLFPSGCEGMARQGALPSSVQDPHLLAEMRKRLPARHPNISQCPGSFAAVFFRFAHSRKRNACAGPRFPDRRLDRISRSEVASSPHRDCRHYLTASPARNCGQASTAAPSASSWRAAHIGHQAEPRRRPSAWEERSSPARGRRIRLHHQTPHDDAPRSSRT